MLDSDTKNRISTLKDILVGKVPNPLSQAEQITTGLIYKFMDDMDQESIEMGGEGSFFVGDYEKYAWKNLFDPKLSGIDRVKFYSEAIEGMYLNPSAPQLFRDIFKNAFLPFKDPRTLKMFLKEIDGFHYSHSEKLGDAFEHLLMLMGVQGDAGMFRTPRHIIDFIVEIVNPQKHESILDPACGTAGFLISSYKHLLKTNSDKKEGDLLSAEDKKKIGNNLVGYDISPEMVRLSLVNMYLHDFNTPNIQEYDTLSSEDKWNEYFDVILANPPFFSPKGGIQPHKRFGVESKKAEVLFTSYILEHLKPNGRAGIIIPEGIIFQTGKAYKELRKQLIENALIGVISLPAGVFNPYAGVKTSILILDKKLNKERDSVFFAEVKNDGFDLGAQRKPIKENDLPDVLKGINDRGNKLGNIHEVEKSKILDREDVSFSLGNYLEQDISNSNFPMVKLGEICEITMGQSPKSEFYNSKGEGLEFHQGKKNFTNLYLEHSEVWASQYNKSAEKNSIVMSVRAPVGPVNISKRKIGLGRGLCGIQSNDVSTQMYLFYMLQSSKDKLKQSSHGSTFDSINKDQLFEFEIPLPPLEVQQEIVDELEGYQKIIDGCKQVVENYQPTIDIDPSWEIVELGEVCELVGGGTPSRKEEGYWKNGTIKWLSCKHLDEDGNVVSHEMISESGLKNSSSKLIKSGSVILVNRVSLGKVVLINEDFAINQDLTGIWSKNTSTLDPNFLFLFLYSIRNIFIDAGQGLGVKGVTREFIKKQKMSIPSIEIQKDIVQKIEEEKKVIEGNKKLIEIYTKKIQDRINKVWGEE